MASDKLRENRDPHTIGATALYTIARHTIMIKIYMYRTEMQCAHYLEIAANIVANPLMEPNLSKVTELLTNIMMHENPIENSPLTMKVNVTSTNHRTGLLQGHKVR